MVMTMSPLDRRAIAACLGVAFLAGAGEARAEGRNANAGLPETLPYVARLAPPPGYERTSHPNWGLVVAGGVFFALGYYGEVEAPDAGRARFVPVAGPFIEHSAGYGILQIAGVGLGAWGILQPHHDFSLSHSARSASVTRRPGVSWDLAPRATGHSGFELALTGRF